MNIPFSSYDVFGYLAAGYAFWFSLDLALRNGAMLNDGWTVPMGLFVTAVAYVTGHMIAGIAKWFLEDRVVWRWLRRPAERLLSEADPADILANVIPEYIRPLPRHIRSALLERVHSELRLDRRGTTLDHWLDSPDAEVVFSLAHERASAQTHAAARLDAFRNLYGFCRNLTMTALLVAITLVAFNLASATGLVDGSPVSWWYPGIALVFALLLFPRYLKFLRHHVFTAYIWLAHAKEPSNGVDDS